MPIRIGVAGLTRLGWRLAVAVRTQADLALRGVYDPRPQRCTAALREGFAAFDDLAALAPRCDVIVNCGASAIAPGVPVVNGPHSPGNNGPLFSLLADPGAGQPAVRVAGSNALAFARLLSGLRRFGPVSRFFATSFRRAGHATDRSTGCIDALEPVFDDDAETQELGDVFRGVVASFHIRRVRGPYTHSDFHMVKIDLTDPITIESALGALRGAPRVVVAAARDGFSDTAQVQEFYRDRGGSRPDRYSVFVWEESIAVNEGSLLLMADVCPETTPVPELLDAVRVRHGAVALADSIAKTDAGLGVWTRWQDLQG
jgi:hypothetical protein